MLGLGVMETPFRGDVARSVLAARGLEPDPLRSFMLLVARGDTLASPVRREPMLTVEFTDLSVGTMGLFPDGGNGDPVADEAAAR